MIGGLYVHIPFCLAKCQYCDFTSYPGRSNEDKDTYLQTLVKECQIYARMFRESSAYGEVSLESIYFGGGTPTCLTGGQLCFLLETIKESFPIQIGAEITVEGNPGTLDLPKLVDLYKGGFNRLSLGAQSFNLKELKLLGRIHTATETAQAFNWAREAGFTNIGLDLMYGLPGQALEHWQSNLQTALSFAPDHISLYQLKIEEGTPFYQRLSEGSLQEFPDDLAALMYEEAIRTLTGAGYLHYEISNFALPGRESRHNRLYWKNDCYIGIGAGASGYLPGVRYSNETVLDNYITLTNQGHRPVDSEENITTELQLFEAVFLGLRLVEGLDKESFFCRYGVRIEQIYGETISRLKEQGLLQEDSLRIALSQKGLNLANLVFMEFLP